MKFDDVRKLATGSVLFSLDRPIVPRLLTLVYLLGLAGLGLWALNHLFAAFRFGFGNGLWGLLEVIVFGLIGFVALRAVCEMVLIYYKANERAAKSAMTPHSSTSLFDDVADAIEDLASEEEDTDTSTRATGASSGGGASTSRTAGSSRAGRSSATATGGTSAARGGTASSAATAAKGAVSKSSAAKPSAPAKPGPTSKAGTTSKAAAGKSATGKTASAKSSTGGTRRSTTARRTAKRTPKPKSSAPSDTSTTSSGPSSSTPSSTS